MYKIKTAIVDGPDVPVELNNACHKINQGLSLLRVISPVISPRGVARAWIAGGALRSRIAEFENPAESDWDLYFHDEEALEMVRSHMMLHQNLDATLTTEDGVVAKYSTKIGGVDLIKKEFGKSPQQCIAAFDFTVCAMAIDIERRVHWHEEAISDIKDRAMRIVQIDSPLGTLLRIQKYARKGYTIDINNTKALSDSIKWNYGKLCKEYNRLTNRIKLGKPSQPYLGAPTAFR